MKYFVFLALIGFAVARPQQDITNIRTERVFNPDGTYSYTVENSDGTIVEQKSTLVNPEEQDPEKRIYAVSGSVKYTTADGTPIAYTYTADDKGYNAVGENGIIPTPPPTPEDIAKAIANLPPLQQRRRR